MAVRPAKQQKRKRGAWSVEQNSTEGVGDQNEDTGGSSRRPVKKAGGTVDGGEE